MRKISTLAALAIVLSLSVAALAAEQYTIDPNNSSATFSVRHNLISNVPGRFSDVNGVIHYDETDITKSSVEATIKVATINTGNDGRDKHLKSPDFFNADKYPEITFKSKRVEKRGSQLVAQGTLTMRGVSKEIELPFEINKLTTPRGTIVGVVAETKLNRQDYGINWSHVLDNGGLVVANEVKIELSLEARPAPATPTTGAAPPAPGAPAKK